MEYMSELDEAFRGIIGHSFPSLETGELHGGIETPQLALILPGREALLRHFDDLLRILGDTLPDEKSRSEKRWFLSDIAANFGIDFDTEILVASISSHVEPYSDGQVYRMAGGATDVRGLYSGLCIGPWYDCPADVTVTAAESPMYVRQNGLMVAIKDPYVLGMQGWQQLDSSVIYVPLHHGAPEFYRFTDQLV